MRHSKFKQKVFLEAAKVAHLTYQIGEADFLREKSQAVKVGDIKSQSIQNCIRKLKRTLLKYRKLTGHGVGISAVQIGISLKIAIIFREKGLVTMINPKITEVSKESLTLPEICMSANPIIAILERPAWIKVEYFDDLGNKQVWEGPHQSKVELAYNRVIQHEIDHMDGIINIDKIDSPKKLILNSDPNFFKKFKGKKINEQK